MIEYNQNLLAGKQKATQAVFMGIGANITQQYLEVLKYCKQNHLPIVNIYVEQSLDEEKLYKLMYEAGDFADLEGAKKGNRTALVFSSKRNLPSFVNLFAIQNLILDPYTELHLAQSQTIFSQNRDKY